MTLVQALTSIKKSKRNTLVQRLAETYKTKQLADLLLNAATAFIETTDIIEVKEFLWNNKKKGDFTSDSELLGVGTFSAGCFKLTSHWVRNGSTFLNKPFMDIEEALVTESKLCQDCCNLAELVDVGNMSLENAIYQMIIDGELWSTECATCGTWLVDVINKRILNQYEHFNVNAIYRYGRRWFVLLCSPVIDSFYLKKVSENIKYNFNIDPCFVSKLTPKQEKELTKIWPVYHQNK